MVAKTDLGATWQCTCGKWNNGSNTSCWKCHEPKVKVEKPPRKKRQKKEVK